MGLIFFHSEEMFQVMKCSSGRKREKVVPEMLNIPRAIMAWGINMSNSHEPFHRFKKLAAASITIKWQVHDEVFVCLFVLNEMIKGYCLSSGR